MEHGQPGKLIFFDDTPAHEEKRLGQKHVEFLNDIPSPPIETAKAKKTNKERV